MSEYTPTMDEIKGWYAGAVDEYRCDTGMPLDEAEGALDLESALLGIVEANPDRSRARDEDE